jgi:hypothetical protein
VAAQTFQEEEEEKKKKCLFMGQYIPVHLRNEKKVIVLEKYEMVEDNVKEMVPSKDAEIRQIQDMNRCFIEKVKVQMKSSDNFRDLVEYRFIH